MKNKNQIKYKKIRGINRRIRAVHQWGKNNAHLDIDYLNEYHNEYVKFWVSPWSRISVTNSVYPEPTGIIKHLMIHYLLDIYHAWDKQLKQHYSDYYLKVWLFEEAVSRSQVVCAVKSKKDFYNQTFMPVSCEQDIQQSQHYSADTADILNQYQWKLHQEVRGYDLIDEFDKDIFYSYPEHKRLGTQNGYHLVACDNVWVSDKSN